MYSYGEYLGVWYSTGIAQYKLGPGFSGLLDDALLFMRC